MHFSVVCEIAADSGMCATVVDTAAHTITEVRCIG